MGEEERMRRIQKHYRVKEDRLRRGPNSEDVWKIREERVEGAFEGDLEAIEEEEMNRGELAGGVG